MRIKLMRGIQNVIDTKERCKNGTQIGSWSLLVTMALQYIKLIE